MGATTRTVKTKFDGDAKGLAAAAKDGEREVDKFNKSVDEKFRKSGDTGGKSFTTNFGKSVKKWFAGDGTKLLGKGGQIGGDAFSGGLMGALKTPILGPALIAALGGAVAVAAPAVGAIAAGGITAGFGAGLVGLGLIFAAKSDDVQKKWKQTMAQAGADTRLLAKPFESTLINISDYFERTVDRFNPALAKSFAKSAPVVDRFVDGVARSLEQLVPVIGPITDGFDAILDSLGPALHGLFGQMSGDLVDLANSVRQNPEALADMVSGIGNVTSDLFSLLTVLNDANGDFERLTGGTSLVTVVFKGLQFAIAQVLGPLALAGAGISALSDGVNALKHDTDASGKSMSDAANKTVLLAQGLGKGSEATKANTKVTEAQTTKFERQTRATDALLASMFRLQNLALGLSGAQINLEAAIDDATASVKENGKNLDVNTAKGRANQSALNAIANSANQQTEAMKKSGKSTDEAGLAAERSRANFVRIAMQMGASRKEAESMAASMIAIPNVSRQARLTADKRDLDTKLADARRQLADPKLTATKKAKLLAEITQLLAAKKKAQDAINALTGKSVYIDAIVRQRGAVKALDPRLGAPGRASGGLTQPNRAYLFGERGPEFGFMGEGGAGRVLSAEETRALLGKQGGPTVLEAHIEIGGEVVRVVRTELKAQNRSLKRTVKAA